MLNSIHYRALLKDIAHRDIWSVEIFKLAFQSEPENPMLDLLLGMSTAHLRLVNPSDNSLLSASYYYHVLGVQKCSDLLPQISDASCHLLLPPLCLLHCIY